MRKTSLAYPRRLAVVLCSLLLVTACGNGDQGATPSPGGTSPTGTPGSDGTGPTQEPVEPVDLGDAVISIGARVLSFAPYFVAHEQGWIEDAGLSVETFDTGGGAISIQALLSGDVLLGGSGSPEAINAALTTGNTKVVATMATNLGSEVVMSTGLAEELGLTRDLPLADRVAALQGLRIGITSSGSTTDQLVRFLFQTHGLNPDTDATIVALGDNQAIIGALRGGSVDVVVLSPPTGQALEGDGVGTVIISPPRGDVPGLTGMIFITFSARTSDLANDEQRARMVAALKEMARFQRMVHDDPDAARELVRESFADLDEEVFQAAWEVVSAGIPDNPVPTEESIRIALEFREATSDDTVEWAYDDIADPSVAEEAIAALDQE